MPSLNPNQVYTYRNGKKLLLKKAEDEFVVRLLPEEAKARGFEPVKQTSSASTKVGTRPESLESQMEQSRSAAPTHHAYYDVETESPFLITDRVMVLFKEGVTDEEIDQFLAKYGLLIQKKYSDREFLFKVTSQTGMNPIKLVVKLTEEEPLVELAENDLNYEMKRYGFSLPTDPVYSRQWHLHKRYRHPEFDPRSSTNCEDAWKLLNHFGSSDVVIGISDDGCKMNHPDFRTPGKIPAWGYFVKERLVTHTDLSADPRKMYQAGQNHGTNCAGVALGSANSVMTVGAAPGCRLVPVKWESNGSILFISDSKFRTALDFIADKVDIFSNSWGASPVFYLGRLVVNRILQLSQTGGRRGKGIVFLWAAGNENCPIDHIANQDIPYTNGWDANGSWVGVETSRFFARDLAALPGVMYVAALSSMGQRSHYSNYGKSISISAPSNNVHTYWRARLKGLSISTADGSGVTDGFGGTSSATPLVAGIAALVISANPRLSALEVISVLKQTASKDLNLQGYPRTRPAFYDSNTSWDVSPVAPFDSGAFGSINSSNGTWSPWFGHGRADALNAVRSALAIAASYYARVIKIASALVNPVGPDMGNEKVTLLNTSNEVISIDGWLLEIGDRHQVLQGHLGAGEAITILLNPSNVMLPNTGATIRLLMQEGSVVQQVSYKDSDVREGMAVVF